MDGIAAAATDTAAVDDCLHLADYIRGGVGVVGGGEGHFAALAGEEERKWMEDPKEEEEWAEGPNWRAAFLRLGLKLTLNPTCKVSRLLISFPLFSLPILYKSLEQKK